MHTTCGDGLMPEASKIALFGFEELSLLASYLLLFQCAWLDLSGLLFQSGLSSAFATRSLKKFLHSRQVWYAFVWVTLLLSVARRIAVGQLIDKDFVFQLSHNYLLFKGIAMSGKDYRQRKPPMRMAEKIAAEQSAEAPAPQVNRHVGSSGAVAGSSRQDLRARVDPPP